MGWMKTLQEMYLAADYRYREGRFLVEQGQFDAGIYLLGYSAEMLLKLAYCRLDPAVSLTDLVAGRLVVAEIHWRTVYRNSPLARRDRELDRHDLVALLIALEDGRHQLGKPPLNTNLLNEHVFKVYANWWVSARYRGCYATEREAKETFDGIEWLRQNHQSLWQ